MAQQPMSAQAGVAASNPALLAATYRLGAPIAQYKSATGGIIFRNILVALLGILCIATIFTGFNYDTIVLFIVGLILVFYAVRRFSVAKRNRGVSIHTGSEGLLHVAGDTVDVMRWDAVSEAWMHFRKNYLTSPWSIYGMFVNVDSSNNGITLSKSFGAARRSSNWYYTRYSFDKYVLRRADGSELMIDKAFSKFKQLSKDLEQGLIAYMMPRLLAAYNAGQTVQFGGITLNTQGMSLYGGQITMSWPELLDVKSGNGYLYIRWKKQGKMLASSERVPMNNVPNVFVMQALVKQIKGGR